MINFNNQFFYKEIENSNGYFVSRDGKIYSTKNNRIKEKSQRIDKDGYWSVALKNDLTGKFTSARVHRIIATAFIPNPFNKPIINHKNGIKDDNSLENLEWSTIAENTQHAYDIGLAKSVKNKTVSLYIENKLICTYNSVMECSKYLKINRNTIMKYLHNDNLKIFNYIELKYEDNNITDYKLEIVKTLYHLNPIKNISTGEYYYNYKDMSYKTGYTFGNCQRYVEKGFCKNKHEYKKIECQEFIEKYNYIK